MSTLADILLKTAECLRGLRYSSATAAGTTTSLVDTSMIEPDTFFNDGTILFLSGTLAGKTAVVTGWDLATSTFTFADQGAAPGAGARYAVADNRYPREAMVAAINEALTQLGPLTQEYTNAAFVVVADQEEYDLPAGIRNLVRVEIAQATVAPFKYGAPYHYWREEGDHLVIDPDDLASFTAMADMPIRLHYNAQHAAVSADTDEISGCIHPMRLAWEAAYLAALTRSGKAENSEPHTKEFIGIATQMRREMRKFPIVNMRRDSRYARW